MQRFSMERWLSPCRTPEGHSKRQGGLASESGPPSPGQGGDRHECGDEKGSRRPSRSTEVERRGKERRREKEGQKEKEEEKEGKRRKGENQKRQRKEGPRSPVRRDRFGPGRFGPETCLEEGPKDKEGQEKEQEEDFRKLVIQRQRNLFFHRPGNLGVVRGRENGAEALEASPRGFGPGNPDGSSTAVVDQARSTSRPIRVEPTPGDDTILSHSDAAGDDTGAQPRMSTLGDVGGFALSGRGGQVSRSGLSTAEIPRGILQGSPARCGSYAGVDPGGESVIDLSSGGRRSRKRSLRRRQGEQKDKVWRRKAERRSTPLGERRKEGQEGRWKERQERWKRRCKEGGRERKRLLEDDAEEMDRLRGKPRQKKEVSMDALKSSGMPGGFDSWTDQRPRPEDEEVTSVTAEAPCTVFEELVQSLTSFEGLMKWTWGMLQCFRKKTNAHVQPTMARDFLHNTVESADVFPLPVPQETSTFSGVCGALNDLAGFEAPVIATETSDLREEIQKELKRVVGRFDIPVDGPSNVSFKQLFTNKGVDYTGEEIRVAKPLNWKAVEASLPDGVGKLPLQDYCRLGTLEYVNNFEQYFLPEDAIKVPRPPRVQVEDGSWDDLCTGLVSKNICEIWPVEDLFHWKGEPLLNGLFAVGKGEFVEEVETQRLIMNLVPVNSMCRSLSGDVSTLPGLAGFSGFTLEEGQVSLISSEDIRCFFYLFSLPQCWKRYLGFNRLVSPSLVPPKLQGKDCVLVARVLPMGFLNSVSIAQHVHRNVVRWSATACPEAIGGEKELRKDRPPPSGDSLYRVYLDNFDQVEKYDRRTAELVKGTVSHQVLQLRHDYQQMGMPRHPKKSVERAYRAEVQGALFDGREGFAIAKPAKIWQYSILAAELLCRRAATLKELQVVCGGYVYIAMFRRPLLCRENEVWRFMQTLSDSHVKGARPLPLQVCAELARFVLLMPLAQMDFKPELGDQITASDASTTGGGICVSEGLTSYGLAASNAQVRGDIPEAHDICQVLTVGLFDGIGALRLAADTLGLPVAGHVSVERDPLGRRTVESWFPDTTFYEDVVEFKDEQIFELSLRYSNVGVILIGAGPPCQGVSGLNADKKGALRDHRSSLFREVPRIEASFRQHFPWAQVRRLMESVASMDQEDRRIMSEAVEDQPYKIDAFGLTLCHRPRLYWVSWELHTGPLAVVTKPLSDSYTDMGTVAFFGSPNQRDLLEPGWELADEWGLPTFTTSRPNPVPGRRPAGIHSCAPHELQRWHDDAHRFPPYQYRDGAGLVNKRGDWRRASISERECLMGFPLGYTKPCMAKSRQSSLEHNDARLTLIGNSWQVGVIVWLLAQLFAPLGMCPTWTVDQVVEALRPGASNRLQTLLLRPPMHRAGSVKSVSSRPLIKKLCGLVSVKGEDLLLQADSEMLVRFHRLRASIPAKLWKWRPVAGWQWRSQGDHINILEMRAILTTVRWLIKKRQIKSQRFLHLTDSLVCLHALTRGRTSSRKLRRTLIRINSLLLVANLHPFWGYVHTSQNPADRPSRRGTRRKWVK